MLGAASPLAPVFALVLEPPMEAAPISLLDALLEDAGDQAIALSNVAQNLGEMDASFNLHVDHTLAALSAELNNWSVGSAFAVSGAGPYASDLEADMLAPLDRLSLDLGTVATMAVGGLQAADLSGSFNAGSLTERIAFSAGAADLAAEASGSIPATVALQNVSINAGEVIGAADLQLAEVDARIAGIGTTAIGALQNGPLNTTVDLTATVQGQLGEITAATAAVVAVLVGS
jgi:hypothetical protein